MTLDSSVMNVSIATVANDIGTTVTGIQTAITLYTLVMASLMIRVVAGTATAVSGRVQRRQAERYAERDAEIMAQRQQAYQQQGCQQQGYQQAAAPPPPPPPPPAEDPIERLKALAELRAQGVLTEEEFAAQKARILGG